jgi:hypothetical protein
MTIAAPFRESTGLVKKKSGGTKAALTEENRFC